MTGIEEGATGTAGLVLFAYDGSTLAGKAIEQASRQIATGRDALVVCVWQPADVGFQPIGKRRFDADAANEVRRAAEETAAFGASLARSAGFLSQGLAVEAAPTWRGIVETAEQRNASLIVLGSHRHSGLVGHFHGNLAAAVIAHSTASVFIVHEGPRGAAETSDVDPSRGV
jgi:nucleotide-binding universal stress UspA family protein